MGIFFHKDENEIFTKLKNKNSNDLISWLWVNLGFPLFTISISLLFYFFSDKEKSWSAFFNFFLNGSIPLVGVNLLVSSTFFWIKFNKEKEKTLGLNTDNFRVKLNLAAAAVYLYLSALFSIETTSSPFNNIIHQISLLILSMIGIYLSLQISQRFFLLQEDMIFKTYDEAITDKVSILKNAIE